jgi:hypothetical protein
VLPWRRRPLPSTKCTLARRARSTTMS